MYDATARKPRLLVELKNPPRPNPNQCIVKARDGFIYMDQATKINGVETVTISRYTPAGTFIDKGELPDTGHGTTFDVWMINGKPHIVMSWHMNDKRQVVNDLAVFPYRPGVMKWTDPAIERLPKFGHGYVNAMLDQERGLICYRYSSEGVDNYEVRWLVDVAAGNDYILGTLELEQGPPSMQGFCIVGQYIYRLTGKSDGSEPRQLERYNWFQNTWFYSGPDLISVEGMGDAVDGFKEPEGVSWDAVGMQLIIGMPVGRGVNRRWPVWAL
jgi:hypothetical protein